MINAIVVENAEFGFMLMSPFCYYHFVSFQHLSFGTVFDNKSLSDSLIVNAAFQQSLWSVAPICSESGVAQGKFVLLYLFMYSSEK